MIFVAIGRLAQLVELPLDVRAVMGSSPLASTKKRAPSNEGALFFFYIAKGLEGGAGVNDVPVGRQSRA